MITGLSVVDVGGAPREIGRGHGESVRARIVQGIDAWLTVVGRHTHMRGADYVESFLNHTDFVKSIDYFTPTLLEEVRGIAEGSGQPFEAVLAYQMMDEEWAYRAALMRARRSGEACSAAGVLRGDGSAVIGQNMDLPSHYDGTQVLLRTRPATGAAVMAFTPAGMIGTTGLNEHGVGVCVNALIELSHRSSGLPVAFVMRGALAQRTARDAASLLKTVPHATGQNYLVADPGRVEDYECSPAGAADVPATGSQVMHTNHVLMSSDIDGAVTPDRDSTTRPRLGVLRDRLGPLGPDVTAADLMGALSDRTAPVCVARGADWMTLGSVVMELRPEPVLHVALGPPADTPYSTLGF